MSSLSYGPVGNPDSKDRFEWAQARMPDGWHVEGQYLGGFFASRQRGTRSDFMRADTVEELVAEVTSGHGKVYTTWADARAGR